MFPLNVLGKPLRFTFHFASIFLQGGTAIVEVSSVVSSFRLSPCTSADVARASEGQAAMVGLFTVFKVNICIPLKASCITSQFFPLLELGQH
jgi:hypothetical protein